MTDATNMSGVDLIWTNSDEFNIMNFDIDASVYFNNTFHHIPPVPGYIRNMEFGIVNAIVLVVHYKLGKGESQQYVGSPSLVYIFEGKRLSPCNFTKNNEKKISIYTGSFNN